MSSVFHRLFFFFLMGNFNMKLQSVYEGIITKTFHLVYLV